jgi:hypothetical protein
MDGSLVFLRRFPTPRSASLRGGPLRSAGRRAVGGRLPQREFRGLAIRDTAGDQPALRRYPDPLVPETEMRPAPFSHATPSALPGEDAAPRTVRQGRVADFPHRSLEPPNLSRTICAGQPDGVQRPHFGMNLSRSEDASAVRPISKAAVSLENSLPASKFSKSPRLLGNL